MKPGFSSSPLRCAAIAESGWPKSTQQALANVERGHAQDVADVHEMLRRAVIEALRALEYFRQIEPDLYRYPAIDPRAFRRAVEATLASDR